MASYKHLYLSKQPIDLPIGKVVCVGRNYMLHIQELNNAIPDEPLLFMKPAEALVGLDNGLSLPNNLGECHNELELAVLIKDRISMANLEQVQSAIWGIGLGLDLTLRDVQSRLKAAGQPWERAKSFDGSCPMSAFVPINKFEDLANIEFSLSVNGETRQVGNSKDMMVAILNLLVNITQQFTLSPGDVVMTGTPKGVAALHSADQLTLELNGLMTTATFIH